VITQGSVVSVATVAKRKYRRKPDQGDGTSSSSEPEIIIHSLPLEELRGIKKHFSHHDGESLTTWLVRCWDNRADSLDLDGREAMQLGSLARDGGIEKATRERAENHCL